MVVLLAVTAGTFLLALYIVSVGAELPWHRAAQVKEEAPVEEVLPPLYPEFHRAELELPQHFGQRPFAEGRKYMWVADHTQCA